MIYYYLDSSAIVKRYIREQGSQFIADIITKPDCHFSTVSISKTEVISALSKRYREKELSDDDYGAVLDRVLLDFDDEYSIIPASQELVSLSARLAQVYPLKGYDCIQLSAAISLKTRLKDFNVRTVLISSDSQVCNAAADEGFEVIDPNKITKEGKQKPPVQPQMQIPVTRPVFDYSDREAILRPLSIGWVVQGPNVKKFEELFAEFTGVKHAVATNSCTAALHLGLLSLGIAPGDEVIVPSFTFIATANAVEYCGARPIFCDVDLGTFNIDIEKIEEVCEHNAQNGNLKAIMPVSLFGLSANMPAICEIAGRYGFRVLEDAACALGSGISHPSASDFGLKHSGTWDDAAAFSFHPRKAMTTGEGGMFTTNSDELADRVRSLRDHGASKSDLQRHIEKGGSLLPEYNVLGFNYRMTDIQGSLGTTQVQKADEIIRNRMARANRYNELLKGIEWLKIPYVPQNYVHAYQSYVCLVVSNKLTVDGKIDWDEVNRLNLLRNRLMAKLEDRGVSTRQGTHAVHTLGYYRDKYRIKNHDYPNSFVADRLSITLPLYPQMTEDEQKYVAQQLLKAQTR